MSEPQPPARYFPPAADALKALEEFLASGLTLGDLRLITRHWTCAQEVARRVGQGEVRISVLRNDHGRGVMTRFIGHMESDRGGE